MLAFISKDRKLQFAKRHPTHYSSSTHALAEACDAFNVTMKNFGYTQKLQQYDPAIHQVHAPQQHPFYGCSLTLSVSSHMSSLLAFPS